MQRRDSSSDGRRLNTKLLLWSAFGATGLFLTIGGAWILSLPPAPPATGAPPIPREETDALIAALKPPKRQRPLIASIGINDATETTDYLMPYGVLRRADVADVVALSTERGPVKLFPALTVEADTIVAEFDAQHPDGADYVLVPAMSRDDDPAVMRWLRSQAGKGAIVIGVCAGAKVVAAAGLLDGKRATTHWYYLDKLRDEHPALAYVANRRVVVDGALATTTGITASMPMSLTLIEAIAGRDKADAIARSLGLTRWDLRHDSDAFRFTRPFALTILQNILAFWKREQFGIPLQPGMDEVSLALVADAWSRTYRSRALTFADSGAARRSANGMRVLPDKVTAHWPGETITDIGKRLPARELDDALAAIEARYGRRTADVVAMQLEYPRDVGDGDNEAVE